MSREAVLTDAEYYQSCCYPNFDLCPDGRRIILARRPAQARATGFVLVTNWNEEIRARLAEAQPQ